MAVTQNNLIGAARGSAGNMTFSSWKGLNVLKNKPASVANPRSDGQVAQRSVITQLVAIFRQVPSALRTAFRQYATGMSAYNAFVKYNADEAFTISGAVATFVASSFNAAKGTLGALVDFARTLDTGRTYDFTWTDNTGESNANASDIFHVLVISSNGLEVYEEDTTRTRAQASGSVTIPGSWSLTGARFCGYFVKADGSMASDSVNIAV